MSIQNSGGVSERKILLVKIDRKSTEGKDDVVKLVFKDLDGCEVYLSSSDVEDVKLLFDRIFDYITSSKDIPVFTLEDTEKDLYHQVAEDIIDQLNSEVSESEGDFEKIWSLSDYDSEADNSQTG